MNELRIHMADVRDANLCSRGTRKLFVYHGVDYAKFLREGIPIEEAEATKNPMVLKIAQGVRERAAKEAANGKA